MLEIKCSSYLSTNSILESKCRTLNLKGTWGSNGYSLAVEIYQKKFSETTIVQDSREADCLTKLVRPVVKTGQTDMAKSAGSSLQRKKRHRSN
jgi:hypothetical protein